jgi:4-diphosphocytidyl-2-C-methyl-D-erythritol kinase
MFTLKAPAKINWSLCVRNRREDGYHNIHSLMQCIALYDTLTFGQSDSIDFISDMTIPPEQNLVMRAAELLRQHTGVSKGARITLEKEIPTGAGLGGGSSDAAQALIGLDRLWGLGLDRGELILLGGRLGSDVPFFFNAPLAIVSGRGDLLEPLAIQCSCALLLVKPPVSVSTPWAYAALASERGENPELTKEVDTINNIKLIYKALASGNIFHLKSLLHNDFEGVVFGRHPEIGEIKGRLLECGAFMALMSGSGSVVFGIFESRDKALSAAGHFSPFFSRVVDTVTSS